MSRLSRCALVFTIALSSLGLASAAQAAGVYVCYAPDYTTVGYPGILGGGEALTTRTPDGVQTYRCDNSNDHVFGFDLPIGT